MQFKLLLLFIIAIVALVKAAAVPAPASAPPVDLMIDCIDVSSVFLESMSIDPKLADLNNACNLCISKSLHKCGMPDPDTPTSARTCYNIGMEKFRFEQGIGGVPVQTASEEDFFEV